jgi:hypothetical protein
MPHVKNQEQDKAAGLRLDAWMKVEGLTDGRLSEKLGCSAASTVATWRHGSRPNKVARKVLAEATGWNWDDPVPESSEVTSKRKRGRPRLVQPSEQPSKAIEFGSTEGMVVALDGLNRLLEGKLSVEDGKLALGICVDMIEGELKQREQNDAHLVRARSLYPLVSGHRDPAVVLGILKESENEKVIELLDLMVNTSIRRVA